MAIQNKKGIPLTWKRVWLSMSNADARRLAAATTKSSVSSSSLSKDSMSVKSMRFESRSTLRKKYISPLGSSPEIRKRDDAPREEERK